MNGVAAVDTVMPTVVHGLFEQWVRRTPDAFAVSSAGESLTYAELDVRAARLARFLAGRGVGPGVVVGLFLDRGVDLVVAELAVLKAGGAYLPLDPGYPAERLSFMLTDTAAPLVLTGQRLRDRVPPGAAEVVCLDTDGALIAAQPAESPEVEVTGSDLAYVMYTSGSTGRPKGVLVEHRGIVRLVSGQTYAALTPADVVAQLASPSFDASTFEVWAALTSGARLAVGAPGAMSVAELGRFLSQFEVSVLWLTAGMFHEVVDADVSVFGGLRLLLAGGDTLSPGHCARVLERFPDLGLVNGYGPTEGTTFTACHRVTEVTGPVPIGVPLAGTEAHVLDEQLRPVSEGELYVGGAGVARGYLNRPDLTAVRFVAGPSGERLYRTGDLVRVDTAGLLHFLGRADDQVKIRGFRVEPGEAQTELRKCCGVVDAVVVVHRGDAAGTRLVAYVVADTGADVTPALLRDQLAAVLPEPFVPSVFVLLDRFPLTPNGKVDRAALPEPGRGAESGHRAPSGEVEAALAEIWAEVLPVDRVGADDAFSALGGNSLLAVRVLARVLARFGVELTVADLFDAPTLADLALKVATRPAVATQAPQRATGSVFPLSFPQERLWVVHELDRDAVDSNVHFAYRISGPLDVAALDLAWRQVVEAHEPLRTTVDSGPRQVIQPDVAGIEVTDLSGGDLDRVLLDEVATPFDLVAGPVSRVRLIRLAEQEHVLVLGVHHIAIDGWSMGVLAGELGERYAALVDGRAAAVEALPARYADFALWQRATLTDAALAEPLRYWRHQLEGAAPLQLPTDRPRPAMRTTTGAEHRFQLSAGLSERINWLAEACGTTVFTVLVAACQVLFARYSGQRDVVVGTAVSGRDRVEFERLVGCFINTLALRSTVDAALPFTEFLGQVRTTVLEAFAHQEVPFERVVSEVCDDRDPSRTPLVQALVVLQNAPAESLRFKGTSVEPQTLPHVSSIFELTVEFTEHDAGMDVMVEYNTDLFDADRIERMAGHLHVLLDQLVTTPDRPVGELSVLTAGERKQLAEWNDTGADFELDVCAHELVAQRAQLDPDAVAVVCGERVLTFRELDERANRIAHHLVGLGVGPDVPVPVCLDRGADFVVAMLGVLKAGGAYVPLDPDSPAARLEFVVGDTGARVVLTQGSVAARMSEVDATVVLLDDDWPVIAANPATAPETAVTAGEVAYVVYTSGSTGRPKGVMVEHRSLINLCRWYHDFYEVTPADRQSQLVALGFDPVALEVWAALTAGASVAVVTPDVLEDPAVLVRWLANTGVTLSMIITPRIDAVFDQLDRVATKLRVVMAGGDVLRRRPRAEFGFRMVNHYGPTEATVLVTGAEVLPEGAVEPGVLPTIGVPVANTAVYVLDPHGNQLPVGVPGELHIGGVCVARGYVNRPELTATRFVPDRFGPSQDARLYRTGDLVRRLPSGELDFLGRIDNQVKIRGYRVEPGEVEVVLAEHPDVAAAVVVAREDAHGRMRLLGYVVPAGREPEVSALLDHVRRVLPDYMVPAAVVVMEEFPLTSRDKVDHAALPEPDAFDVVRHVAPRTDAQRVLAGIWAEAIGVPEVGIEDNFFSLGGDSIVAMQVVAKARDAGLRLSARDLFQRPTIAALDGVVASEPVAVAAVRFEGRAPLTPIERFFFDTFTPSAAFHQHVTLELPVVAPAVVRAAVEALVQHHGALRTRFGVENGEWWQEESAAGVTFESVADIDRAVELASGLTDLTEGSLVGAALVPGEPARLVLAIHHLAVDGVSWRVLIEDLWVALEQARRGERITLASTTGSPLAWASRLAGHVAAGGFADAAEYWSALAGADVSVPVDGTGPNSVESTRIVRAGLDVATTAKLLREVPPVYRTEVGDVLVAALGRVLAAWTGRSRVLLGMEGHGREELFEDLDITRTVGWFTSRFPVAIEASADDWGTALKSVKEQLRAVPLRGLGYGSLRDAGLVPALDPPVVLNYLGQFDSAVGGFGSVSEIGLHQHPGDTRPHLVDVVGTVLGGCLEFRWYYSANVHDEQTITMLADRLVAELTAAVAHCLTPRAGGRTPSDFPLAEIDQSTVDEIVGARRDVADIYPLTPTQNGMLFHSLMDRSGIAYFEQISAVVEGVRDPSALATAWQRVAGRVPVLRTAFVWEDVARPYQVVSERVRVPVTELDWRELSSAELESAVTHFLDQDRKAGLDLGEAPLMRVALIRLTDTRVRLVWTFHHALLDGWSGMQVLAEVLGECADEPVAVVRRPFRDYVEWLGRQDSSAAREHWRATMAGFEAATPLPFDRQKSGLHRTVSSARLRVSLPEELTARVYAAAKDAEVTVNTVVQGVWALLLSRYSGETDVCFGATVAGRPAELAGVDQIAGMFINTLPVRVNVDQDGDLVTWLRGQQTDQAVARQYEHVSLTEVVEWCGLPHGRDLFDSIVVFENYPIDAAEEGAPSIVDIGSASGTNYPLNVVVYPEDSLSLLLHYDPALFDPATVQRMAGHLRALFESVADGGRVGELTMLDEAERRKLLTEWASTGPAEEGRRLHEVISARAASAPEAVAVVHGGVATTYGELDAAANRLAHHLAGLGVGRDVLVGVSVARSTDLVVAVLAVLKAGGAYVPLDPDYPEERLATMLAETRPSVLLTLADQAGRFAESEVDVVQLDRDRAAIEALPATAPDVPGDDRDLAYVMFTSGSTGTPKGVMVEHRSLHNVVQAINERYALTQASSVLQVCSMSFDGGVQDIFTTLTAGATLVLAGPDALHDPAKLARQLRTDGITVASLPPAVLAALDPAELSGLECVGTGGDVCPVDLVEAWAPGRRFVNIYGPTESTLAVTLFPAVAGAGYRTVPLGEPIAGVRLHVLDTSLAPVPAGVTGELYIGGAGLARGYAGRPDLTAERFVADPVGAPGERLYRTGDLVRWRPDGLLEFVARTDDQVKIRGFRVEPGEIENTLIRHPSVAEVVVTAPRTEAGNRQLVAYVVPTPDAAEPVGDTLRKHLTRSLPDYLVPSAFVRLPKLPLTPNGKVDRRALPRPSRGDVTTAVYRAPANSTEEALCREWAEVLGRDQVGVDDDFFTLGGDSISSLRLMSRVRRSFGVEVSPRDLFDAPTVAGLAERIVDLVLAKLENDIALDASGRN